MDVKDQQRKLEIFKAKKWTEIKSLEQECQRNLNQIIALEERQKDISFEVQKKLSQMNEKALEIDTYMYKNKIGLGTHF